MFEKLNKHILVHSLACYSPDPQAMLSSDKRLEEAQNLVNWHKEA